jgi:hypothetical protein
VLTVRGVVRDSWELFNLLGQKGGTLSESGAEFVRRTFPLADVNGDGRVSFAEFKQFIQLKAWNTHLEMAVEDLVEQVAQQVDESLQESTLQTIEDSLQESLDVSQSLLDDELENTSDQPPPLATLPGTVLRNGELWPDRPAYYVRLQEQWVATSWAEYARLVRQTARAMLQLGVERGRTVCMLGDNRPEWTILMSQRWQSGRCRLVSTPPTRGRVQLHYQPLGGHRGPRGEPPAVEQDQKRVGWWETPSTQARHYDDRYA